HSSGGHLAGCVVITEWEKQGLPRDILKGALLGSGMYDLKPARQSARSRYVKFTDAMEEALSAERHLDKIHTPLVLVHGTLETPVAPTHSLRAMIGTAPWISRPARPSSCSCRLPLDRPPSP